MEPTSFSYLLSATVHLSTPDTWQQLIYNRRVDTGPLEIS